MKTLLYGMLAETSIHPGAGQSSGFVDLPVAREAATDYPVIVGSSLKGALLAPPEIGAGLTTTGSGFSASMTMRGACLSPMRGCSCCRFAA